MNEGLFSAYESRDELRNYISDLSDFKVITEYIEQKANPADKRRCGARRAARWCCCAPRSWWPSAMRRTLSG